MREILERSFWQLFIVYALLIVAISFGRLFKYMLHFEIFAVIIAIAGVIGLNIKSKKKAKEPKKWGKYEYALLALAVIIILVTRIMPYIDNTVPLGYDPGMYKSTMDAYAEGDIETWMKRWSPKGLFLLTSLTIGLGFTSAQLLIGGLIILEVLLCLSFYVAGKEFFGSKAGVASALFYAISVVQFRAFGLMYYKNILAMSVLLIAIYFVHKKQVLPAVLTGSFLSGLHRPTFLLFGLSYIGFMAYDVFKSKKFDKSAFKWDFKIGFLILAVGTVYHVGVFQTLIAPLLRDTATASIGSGTFINFFTYQYSSLFYLVFSCLGFLFMTRERKFNQAWFLVFITGVIVYFQIIFFNRFIIHLDLALLMVAGYGFTKSFDNNKKMALALAAILLLAGAVSVFKESDSANPYIRPNELAVIEHVQSVEENAYLMVTSSYYSPWVEGYSGRVVIAPGLFDANDWNYGTWQDYWVASEPEEALAMLEDYERPLYIFVGFRALENKNKYRGPCFEVVKEHQGSRLFKVVC
ncbi:hypothetical protein ACFL1B_05570 [Nanoarchaeota archaeon]